MRIDPIRLEDLAGRVKAPDMRDQLGEVDPGDAREVVRGAIAHDQVLALDEALKEFEERDPRAAQLVKLRHFAGLTMPETAEALGVSLATAEKDWAYAKSWLKRRLSAGDDRR